MKRVILFLSLSILLVFYNQLQAQFENPNLGLGFSVGAAKGSNSSADKWEAQYVGSMQYKIFSPYLLGQASLGYAQLKAPGVYSTETGILANRFMYIPFSLDELNPFAYAGIGVTKAFASGSHFLPTIPFGVGLQTMLGNQIMLEVSGGYNLSLSDKLDSRVRTDGDLNGLTNNKNDGSYGILIGLMFAASNPNYDMDNDGLSKKLEKELGSDPENADTDGDGLNDGDEYNIYKTDLFNADTDADGLSDYSEIKQHKTDPLVADTDKDGLNDGDEINQYKTDALTADNDNDGLNDGKEIAYKSDPNKADTDGDSLNDGTEVNQYKTDPAKLDTDGDGLNDGEEINKYYTSAVKIDTDGGGINDGAEVKRATNPSDSNDDFTKPMIVFEKGKNVIIKGINFEFDKATLTKDSEIILEIAYNALVLNPDVNVEISGHTDNIGTKEYNQDISLRRAQSVRNWLEQRGISSTRMFTVGKGMSEPITSNVTDEGRAENRRTEFFVER